jgi:hypothetical protein
MSIELYVFGQAVLFGLTTLVVAIGLDLFKELPDKGIRHDDPAVPPSW